MLLTHFLTESSARILGGTARGIFGGTSKKLQMTDEGILGETSRKFSAELQCVFSIELKFPAELLGKFLVEVSHELT